MLSLRSPLETSSKSWKTRSRSATETKTHRNEPARPVPAASSAGKTRDPPATEAEMLFSWVAGAPTPAPGNLIRAVEDFHGAGRQGNLERLARDRTPDEPPPPPPPAPPTPPRRLAPGSRHPAPPTH